jgi:hypothetical protein
LPTGLDLVNIGDTSSLKLIFLTDIINQTRTNTMLSINDAQFTTWWETMIKHPSDTAHHFEQLEFMIEQGLNLDEENDEGSTIVDFLLRELEDPISEAHTLHFEQVLLWVCERVTPTAELIKSFERIGCYHALEEILKRYEGPKINIRGRHLLSFVEVLLGYDNVVDVDALGKRFRAAFKELMAKYTGSRILLFLHPDPVSTAYDSLFEF